MDYKNKKLFFQPCAEFNKPTAYKLPYPIHLVQPNIIVSGKNSHLGRLYELMPRVTHSGVNVAFITKFSEGDKVPISQHHDPNLRPH